MSNKAFGIIHDYYPRERMISIKEDGSLRFFYFGKSMVKNFSKAMSHKSVFIFFDYSDNVKVLGGREALEIVQVDSIEYATMRGLKTLFSQDTIEYQSKTTINDLGYKMFVDFEFTMPDFGVREKFVPELLQIGAVIVNEKDEIVDEYSNYIKTNTPISHRTKKFLKIDDFELADAISQEEFYNDLSEFVKLYSPTFIVWGGSDQLELNMFYKINKFKPLTIPFLDLSQMIKKTYELKEEVSLFNALKIFAGTSASQAHHALTDAAATKEVFDSFKLLLNSGIEINLKEIIQKMRESKDDASNEQEALTIEIPEEDMEDGQE